jgi:pyruvate carboxylase subunit B
MKYAVEVAGRTIEVEVDGDRVLVGGRPVAVRLDGEPGTRARRLVRGRLSRPFVASADGRGTWVLSSDGSSLVATVLDPRERAVRAAGGQAAATPGKGTLKAPMPGLVLRVLAAEGARVEQGQGLVVVEAMKMENELKAAGSGTVKQVHVKPGDRVEKGAPLVELG